MRSRVNLLKHPLHPILVIVPSALFPLMLFFDAIVWVTNAEGLWPAGFWLALAGVVTVLAAMVPGFVDLAGIPNERRAHKVALFHMSSGLLLLVLYAVALWVRWPVGNGPDNFAVATALDVVGTIVVGIQGWLGGELVYKHHLGVETPEEGGDPTPLAHKRGPGRSVRNRRV